MFCLHPNPLLVFPPFPPQSHPCPLPLYLYCFPSHTCPLLMSTVFPPSLFPTVSPPILLLFSPLFPILSLSSSPFSYFPSHLNPRHVSTPFSPSSPVNCMKKCKFNLIKTTCKCIHENNSKRVVKKTVLHARVNFTTTYASKGIRVNI